MWNMATKGLPLESDVAYCRNNQHQNESRKHMKNGKDGCSDGPGPHLSPYFNDAKMVRFALRGPSLLP